jgi:hypothetical protein
MKKLAIMQPYILPYVGYFQAMKAVDQYVIYDDVQFVKGGWINRNHILLGGRRQRFTLPLAGASPNKLINQIEFKGEFAKFQQTLAQAYARAPQKAAVLKLMAEICAHPDRRVHRFIGNSFIILAEYLGFETQFVYSSELPKDPSLRAQDRVLAICDELGATTYINAIGGRSLYSREAFWERGIEIYFLKPDLVPYCQLGQEFVPGLSIIDVLMFNSIEETNRILDEYELM